MLPVKEKQADQFINIENVYNFCKEIILNLVLNLFCTQCDGGGINFGGQQFKDP